MTNNTKNILLVGAAIAIYFLWNKKKKECEESSGGGGGGTEGGGGASGGGFFGGDAGTILPIVPTQTNISVTTCPEGKIAQNGVCVDAPSGNGTSGGNGTNGGGGTSGGDTGGGTSGGNGTSGGDTGGGTNGGNGTSGDGTGTNTTTFFPCDKGQKEVNGECVAMTCEDKGKVTINGLCYTQEEAKVLDCARVGGVWNSQMQNCYPATNTNTGNTNTGLVLEEPTPRTPTQQETIGQTSEFPISNPRTNPISNPVTTVAENVPIIPITNPRITFPTTTTNTNTPVTNPRNEPTTTNDEPIINEPIVNPMAFADTKHPFFKMPKGKKQNLKINKDFFNVKQGFNSSKW